MVSGLLICPVPVLSDDGCCGHKHHNVDTLDVMREPVQMTMSRKNQTRISTSRRMSERVPASVRDSNPKLWPTIATLKSQAMETHVA